MRLAFLQRIIDILRGKSRAFGLDSRVRAEKPYWIDSHSTFGDYSQMGRHVNITHANIGRYCTIGNFVQIGAGEHDVNKISTSALSLEDGHDLVKLPLTIANDVWIGDDSIIRRGITIGNCAIILPNSFVNKNVPDFAIVMGTPAKIIGYRFDEQTRELINKTQYWVYTPKKAKKIIKDIEKQIVGVKHDYKSRIR